MTIRNRFLVLAALLGASSLALTGCVLPVGGGDNNGNGNGNGTSETDNGGGTETETAGGDAADIDLSNTEWVGEVDEGNGVSQVELLLNADGTVDFIDFGGGGSIDHPDDTWSVDGDTVTISLVYENAGGEYNIDMTGDLDAERLELSEGGIGGMSITLDRA